MPLIAEVNHRLFGHLLANGAQNGETADAGVKNTNG
jgi:hypothetical protein